MFSEKNFYQTVVILWLHKADADIAIGKEREGAAVPNHHLFFDTTFKEGMTVFLFILNAKQHKVCGRIERREFSGFAENLV
jgi:hypothetical protein